MRHRFRRTRLNRDTTSRNSLFKNLSVSLIQHEQIQTTLSKAKMLRAFIEPLITLAKKNPSSLVVRRRLVSVLPEYESVTKLINVIAKRYLKRPGGYTRIIKSGFRQGDSAPLAYIEFVDNNIQVKGLSFAEQDSIISKAQVNKVNKG